jgi:hypothetical protein
MRFSTSNFLPPSSLVAGSSKGGDSILPTLHFASTALVFPPCDRTMYVESQTLSPLTVPPAVPYAPLQIRIPSVFIKLSISLAHRDVFQ